VQFRRIEFAFGYKRSSALHHYPEGSDERAELERALGEPTVWDAFLRYLERQGFAVPAEALDRDVGQAVAPSAALQEVLLHAYRKDTPVNLVCERLVDLDEGLQEWRYRHVKMVERTIGTKVGSGGSSGVEYLKSTLFRPLFPDLWAIRVSL